MSQLEKAGKEQRRPRAAKNQQIKFQKKKRSLKKKSRDLFWESQVVLVIKNLPANAGDIRDVSLIPRSGRYPGGGYNVLHDI